MHKNMEQLIESIINDNRLLLEHCLKSGVSADGYEDFMMVRPLHFAVLYDRIDLVPLLLAAGADPFQTDHNGESPFQMARSTNNTDMIKLFEQLSFNKFNSSQ